MPTRKENMDAQAPSRPTVGSLFAGIGGFDLGFEQAGFTTAWQVEISDVPRAVLADRFPHAKQFTDVRTCLPDLWHTDVIIGGFPCQDVSTAGKRRGLAGFPSGTNIDISGANICLVADGRSKMVERGRTVADNGLRKGLDASNFAEARAAGNAVCPQVARWIAEKLIKTF